MVLVYFFRSLDLLFSLMVSEFMTTKILCLRKSGLLVCFLTRVCCLFLSVSVYYHRTFYFYCQITFYFLFALYFNFKSNVASFVCF